MVAALGFVVPNPILEGAGVRGRNESTVARFVTLRTFGRTGTRNESHLDLVRFPSRLGTTDSMGTTNALEETSAWLGELP